MERIVAGCYRCGADSDVEDEGERSGDVSAVECVDDRGLSDAAAEPGCSLNNAGARLLPGNTGRSVRQDVSGSLYVF